MIFSSRSHHRTLPLFHLSLLCAALSILQVAPTVLAQTDIQTGTQTKTHPDPVAGGTRAAQVQQGSETTPAASAHPATLSVQARLISIPVVVRDKKGTLLTQLTQGDFALQVDGKPAIIRYFDHDAQQPLTLGLLVDTSMSQRDVLDEERTASEAFLDQMLTNKGDRGFVIQFARSTELLADLTDSKAKLRAALKEVGTEDTQSTAPSDADDQNGNRRGNRRNGTVLYDAAFLASDELMARQKGRKALVLLTDGDDHGSKETLAEAIETAQRADTTVYAIYFKGQDHDSGSSGNNGGRRGGGWPGGGGGWPGGGGGWPGNGGGGGHNGGGPPGGGSAARADGKKILERMTGETGGRVYEVSRKEPVTEIYKQIAEDLRSQYLLGYSPDQETGADGYHRIDISLKDPKLKAVVQTRDGYYAGGTSR